MCLPSLEADTQRRGTFARRQVRRRPRVPLMPPNLENLPAVEPAMTKPYEHWHVLPHGELSKVDDNMLTVEGQIRMPLGSFPRRMTVVRLEDSRLVVWSAIALDDPEMAKLDAFGRPAFMIVPNGHHRLDARAWKERYPQIRVVAPPGARARIEEVVPVDTTAPDFGDPDVQFVTVRGTRDQEAALVVSNATGSTLILNDLVGNIRSAAGITNWLLRFAGFAGDEAQIPKVVKMSLVKDAEALRGQLSEWAEISSLKRILVSHGAPIEANAREMLRELAASL